MRSVLRPDRLPQSRAGLVLVSGQYPQISRALEQIGIRPFLTEPDTRLPSPVAWHPDMQACGLDGKLFVLRGGPLSQALHRQGLGDFCRTSQEPGDRYPEDVICNVLSWTRFAMGNPHTADQVILQAAKDAGLQWISVKQGYAACSTALVDGHTAITADAGVAIQLERQGLETLRIEPGYISLPGYRTGFLGGCCGKIAPDVMAFAGQLKYHPDGQKIRAFLRMHGVRETELIDGCLLDIGGLLALS